METLKDVLAILLGIGAVIVVFIIGWSLLIMFWPTLVGIIAGGYLIETGHKTWGIIVIILGIMMNFSYLTDDRSRYY
jgi:hypothetical protein